MILPKVRDPRFITIRRGGSLTDANHRLLALWAATCAEHVLHLFESVQPSDARPRLAIDQIRKWASGDITMTESRSAGGHAMAAARELRGAARHAAFAAGQAAVVAHDCWGRGDSESLGMGSDRRKVVLRRVRRVHQ